MSRHWAARVVAIDGGSVAIELTTLHDEAGAPDITPTFALSLVLEHWQRVVRGIDVRREFADNLPRAQADPRLLELYELCFYRELEVDRATYERACRDRAYEGRPLVGGGPRGPKSAPRYVLRIAGDWQRYTERASELVHGVHATDTAFPESYHRWPDDPALRPRVTLRFEIDPPLVAFLRVTMSWETTAYR